VSIEISAKLWSEAQMERQIDEVVARYKMFGRQRISKSTLDKWREQSKKFQHGKQRKVL
jgi:hypothetical protein